MEFISVKARLVGVEGDYELGSEATTIGRNAANSIPVPDHQVSGLHCRIDAEDGRFSIADCESRNGTFVNGRPVQCVTLEHGDEIRIGRTLFRFLTHPLDELRL